MEREKERERRLTEENNYQYQEDHITLDSTDVKKIRS